MNLWDRIWAIPLAPCPRCGGVAKIESLGIHRYDKEAESEEAEKYFCRTEFEVACECGLRSPEFFVNVPYDAFSRRDVDHAYGFDVIESLYFSAVAKLATWWNEGGSTRVNWVAYDGTDATLPKVGDVVLVSYKDAQAMEVCEFALKKSGVAYWVDYEGDGADVVVGDCWCRPPKPKIK